MATKKKKPAPRKVGRPPSPFQLRTPIRHDEEQIAAWRTAAALAGVPLADWMRNVLVLEARRPAHVLPIARSRRG